MSHPSHESLGPRAPLDWARGPARAGAGGLRVGCGAGRSRRPPAHTRPRARLTGGGGRRTWACGVGTPRSRRRSARGAEPPRGAPWWSVRRAGRPRRASAPAGLLAALTTKVRHEEVRLRERFGDDYEAYRRRTPRFFGLPRLTGGGGRRTWACGVGTPRSRRRSARGAEPPRGAP